MALLPRLGRFEREPADARFVIEGNRVRVAPAVPGRRLDGERIGTSLVRNLAARAHRARFVVTSPKLTTEAAERLRITELVSEFTTNYPCCPPRVTNIKRAAELLDGTIILPGKEFSLNDALGKRTEAKGFVSAPQIFNGRFEDSVGGGISQVATTLFNAAFFSGIKLVAHQAHQFYISRYPMGREATVSWGGPELIFRNDWPAAILMKLAAGDSGITVRFYSSKLGRRVTTTTGKPYAPTTPKTITVTNAALPAGAREVVQEAGEGGFTVDYTRQVFRGSKRIRNERYTVEYDAVDEVVEVGPASVVERLEGRPTGVVVDDPRLDVADLGPHGEAVEDEVAQRIGVRDADVEQEVVGPGDVEELDHLRHRKGRLAERVDVGRASGGGPARPRSPRALGRGHRGRRPRGSRAGRRGRGGRARARGRWRGRDRRARRDPCSRSEHPPAARRRGPGRFGRVALSAPIPKIVR